MYFPCWLWKWQQKFSQPFCSCWNYFQTFDQTIFCTFTFLEQGGTCWHYRTHKWYVIRKSLGTTDLMQIRSCLPALKLWQPSSIHGTEQLQMLSWSAKQDMRSKLVSWLLQPMTFSSWRQNRQSTKMYVVHHNTLSDSFWIQIVWFQPKQDSDIIFTKQDRIG